MNAFTLFCMFLGVVAVTSALECHFKEHGKKDVIAKCSKSNTGLPDMPGTFLSNELGNLFPGLAQTGNSSVAADEVYVCFRLQWDVKIKDEKMKDAFEKTCKGGKCVTKGCQYHYINKIPLTEGCASIEAKTKKPELDAKVSYCHCEKDKCNGALSNAAPSALLAVVGLFVAKFTVAAF